MIVSHKHRFIFLKTRKAAGTSIEVVLSKIAGDDAIVTQVHPPEEGHKPRNFEALQTPRNPSLSLQDLEDNHELCKYVPYLPHMPAWMARAKLSRDVWCGYFKFCFERNPWDKIVSMYWWRNREVEPPPPFNDWLVSAPSVTSDWPIYAIDDHPAVDTIGRYERLSTDLGEVLRRLGIVPEGLSLPRAKSGFRRREGLYSPDGARHVRRVFHREIELFGYDCPPSLMM